MEGILTQLEQYVMQAGFWGPIIYIFALILAIVISPIPSSPLVIFAGLAFGWIKGMIYTMAGATIGAIIAFWIAKKFGRPLVEKLVSHEKLSKIENYFSEEKLVLTVFLLRLPPLPFFDAVSYAAGLTKISFKNFTLATFFGLIPIVFVLSFFGESINSLNYLLIALAVFFVIFLLFLKFYQKRLK